MARGMNTLLAMIDRRRQAPRRVPRRRRPQLGRSPPVPVPRHRVVLPARLPRVPDLDVDPRARRRRSTKLEAGARVADVGCGHGASVVVMADAYPKSTIHGFDFHAPSIETRKARAEEAGRRGPHRVRGRDREGLSGNVRPHLLLRLPPRHGRPGGDRPVRARAPRRPAARSCWSSRWRSTVAPRTSPRTRSPRCSTRRRRRSARRTPCRRRSASGSAPRRARRDCGRCSRKPATRTSGGPTETPLNMILEARA